MRLVVRLHETAEVDVRVALGGRQARVPEELLDRAQVGARAEELRREGVTERMRGRLGGGAAHEHVAPELTGDAPARQPPAARVPEDGAARDRLTVGGARGPVRRE